MAEKLQLATISVLITNRQVNACKVQEILTASGHIVRARMGVNIQPKCMVNCTGIITIIVEGSKKEIDKLTSKLNKLYGIEAKSVIMAK